MLNIAFHRFDHTVTLATDAYRISVRHGRKRVQVVWPEVAEVVIDFEEDGARLHSESLEYYEGELDTAQVTDVARVVATFLLRETRLVEVGGLLTRKKLQYLEDDPWKPIWG